MAMRRRRGRGGRSGRLPPARVEWLPNPIQGSEVGTHIVGSLNDATQREEHILYDFSDTSSGVPEAVAGKYGGGDWTFERTIGGVGLSGVVASDDPNKLIQVCFSIGMLNVATSALDPRSLAVGNIGSPIDDVQISWMIRVCCWIRLGQFEITKCDLGMGRTRKIAPDSRVVLVAELQGGAGFDQPSDALGASLKYAGDLRWLVRQRGSRI